MPVIDPNHSGQAKGGSSAGDPKDDSKKDDGKKDDTISDLFESDKKDEKTADAVLTPIPPADIALEIGMAPTADSAIAPADPNMTISNFDIGGDISFDSLPETNIIVDGATSNSTDSSSTPTPETPLTPNPDVPAIALGATAPSGSLSGTFLGTDGATNGPAVLGATPDALAGTTGAPTTSETPTPAI